MLVVVDLDGVLLDDARFKRDYIRMFGSFGIPAGAYQRAYEKVKKQNGGWYEPNLHIRTLKKQYPEIEAGILKKEANLFASRASDYVYPDARKFLSYLRVHAIRAMILSSGPAFQKRKVEGSGLGAYFNAVKIVRRASKLASMKALLRAGQTGIFFLDDKRKVTDEIKRNMPHIFVIQVRRRSDQEKSLFADAIVANLGEAEKILRKKFS